MYEITAALQLILVYAARAEDLDGAKGMLLYVLTFILLFI